MLSHNFIKNYKKRKNEILDAIKNSKIISSAFNNCGNLIVKYERQINIFNIEIVINKTDIYDIVDVIDYNIITIKCYNVIYSAIIKDTFNQGFNDNNINHILSILDQFAIFLKNKIDIEVN